MHACISSCTHLSTHPSIDSGVGGVGGATAEAVLSAEQLRRHAIRLCRKRFPAVVANCGVQCRGQSRYSVSEERERGRRQNVGVWVSRGGVWVSRGGVWVSRGGVRHLHVAEQIWSEDDCHRILAHSDWSGLVGLGQP